MRAQVPPWWEGVAAAEEATAAYPMDYYAKNGGAWNSSYHKKAAQREPRPAALVSPHPRGGVQKAALVSP
jgi:2-(3-amino-3-carboxypropyl)histidine synthase